MASQPEEDDGTTASMGDSDHEDKIMDDVAGQNAAASDGEEMPRTEEKEEELSGYAKAAGHALFKGELVWQIKPDPYVHNTVRHTDEDLNDFERRVHDELWAAYRRAPVKEMVEEEEVEVKEFEWENHSIRWEKFLKFDWTRGKNRFKDSTILKRYKSRTQSAMKEKPDKPMNSPSDEARKILPKKHITESSVQLYVDTDDESNHRWADLKNEYEMAIEVKSSDEGGKVEARLEKILTMVRDNWNRWGKKITKDVVEATRINQIAAGNPNLLRDMPEDKIYIAVDRKEMVIGFLIPGAIQDAFGLGTIERMETDTHHLYSNIRKPSKKSNKRNQSEVRIPGIDPETMGTEHYGHWHAVGRSDLPIVELSDTLECGATIRQAILTFLENTGGTMTRLLDFWFGVWDRELRDKYWEVYEKSPKFARLPKTNPGRPEPYKLRVVVCNRPTDEHDDDKDWVGGLTGLVHVGSFTGGEMCLKELGIRLSGYQNGAMLLFRGAEIRHYVAPWLPKGENGCRYAFDHTTHKSVEKWARETKTEGYPKYVEPDLSKPKIKKEPGTKPKKKGPKPAKAVKSTVVKEKGEGRGSRKRKAAAVKAEKVDSDTEEPSNDVPETDGPPESPAVQLRNQFIPVNLEEVKKRKAESEQEDTELQPSVKKRKGARRGSAEVEVEKADSEPTSPRRRSPRTQASKSPVDTEMEDS